MSFDISIDRLMQYLCTLANAFPQRHSGDPEERLAVQYIADTMKSTGLMVQIQEIPIMGWEVVSPPVLEVLKPDNRIVECAPFIFSGGTPPEGLEGELVRVGTTAVMTTRRPKLALQDALGQTRAWVIARVDGPAVCYSGPPAGEDGSQAAGFNYPACMIGQESYRAIQTWLEAGKTVRVRYRLTVRYRPQSTAFNVEGILPGTSKPEESVVILAHHDTQGALGLPEELNPPGANDNASGVAGMLEMARALSAMGGLGRTLRFVTVTGEERGLLGSREYVRRLIDADSLKHIVGMMNLDQLANGEYLALRCSANEPHLQQKPDGTPPFNLRVLAQKYSDELGLSKRYEVAIKEVEATSDHWPFYQAGIPTIAVIWRPMASHAFHRAGDNVTYCSASDKYLASVSIAAKVLNAMGEVRS